MARSHDEEIRAQFTAQVERFVSSPHVNAPEPVARLVRLVAPRRSDRALDVACGPGLLARAFLPHVAAFFGIDVTPAMLAKARDVAPQAGFLVGTASTLPFPSATFDVVLSRLALHHLLDPSVALGEMARVLRPGGRLGVLDLLSSEIEEEAAYHHRVERLRDPSRARALPLSELVHLIGRSGLTLSHVDLLERELDVDDWIARAEQSAADAAEARALLVAAIGTRRFGGRPVFRDEHGRLTFTYQWAIVVAQAP